MCQRLLENKVLELNISYYSRSYYSEWIPEFSNSIKPLTSCKSFPLSSKNVATFECLISRKQSESLMLLPSTRAYPWCIFHEPQAENLPGRKRTAKSRPTTYNPERNGQVERNNRIIWKVVEMSLNCKNLAVKKGKMFFQMNSILSSLYYEQLHEQFFRFRCHSSPGVSIPTWVAEPFPGLLK